MRKNTLKLKERTNRTAFTFSSKATEKYCVKEVRNFDCRDGVLRTAPAKKKMLTTDGSLMTCGLADVVDLAKLPYYDSNTRSYLHKYCALTAIGLFYYQSGTGAAFALKGEQAVKGCIAHCADLEGMRHLAVFGSGVNILFSEKEVIKKIIRYDSIGPVCFLKNRIFFALTKGGIMYTAPDDLTNVTNSIEDGGLFYVPNNPGQIVALRAVSDMLYVFFDKGIMRLDVGGAPKDFKMKTLNYDGGKIFGRTVCVCGENIIFMASDGAYRLHGDKAERILADFVQTPSAETEKEGHAVWQDRAIICYKTAEGEKTLVVYGDGKDAYYMNPLFALSEEEGGTALFLDEDKVICELSDEGDVLFSGSTYSMETDFNRVGVKTLRKLLFKGVGTFELTLQTDKRIWKKMVTLENGGAEIPLALRGEKFTFSFLPMTQMKVFSMTAEWKQIA